MTLEENKIVIYEEGDEIIEIILDGDKDTIWLNQKQIAELFEKDIRTISEHVNNIYNSEELEHNRTLRKFQIVQTEGKREVSREIDHYNLDMIISVGYRVNSKKATKFRQWATKTLKRYLVDGYAINEKRLLSNQGPDIKELLGVIDLIKNKIELPVFEGHEKELLTLIEDYAVSWNIFHSYDKGELILDNFKHDVKYKVNYSDSKTIVEAFRKNLILKEQASELFGQELDEKLKSVIGSINQEFGNKEIYNSVEEKAAHLLYLIIKDHPFVDGNKRIGSVLFVHFLQKNDFIWKVNKEKKINDNALVALALLVASSDPKDKDTMIKLIIKLIQNDYVGKTTS